VLSQPVLSLSAGSVGSSGIETQTFDAHVRPARHRPWLHSQRSLPGMQTAAAVAASVAPSLPESDSSAHAKRKNNERHLPFRLMCSPRNTPARGSPTACARASRFWDTSYRNDQATICMARKGHDSYGPKGPRFVWPERATIRMARKGHDSYGPKGPRSVGGRRSWPKGPRKHHELDLNGHALPTTLRRCGEDPRRHP
jgi:hypothetical protein